jgi:hypothetical protein
MRSVFFPFLCCAFAGFVFTGAARADDTVNVSPKTDPAAGAAKPETPVTATTPAVNPAPEKSVQAAPPPVRPAPTEVRPVAQAGATTPVKVDSADSDAAREAREELAEAQRMADAALAAAESTQSSSDSSGTDAQSTPAAASPATTTEIHHSMDELVQSGSQLGPDSSDPTHHSMGALIRSAHRSASSDSKHHTMDSLLY